MNFKPHEFLLGIGAALAAYTVYMLLSGRSSWTTDRVAVSDWYWPWHQ